MKLLPVVLLLLIAGCSGDDSSVLVRRSPSEDLSVRRLYIAVPSNRLIGEREALPDDPAALVIVDLVEYDGTVRALRQGDPARGGCSSRWEPDLRASDIFPDHPRADRAGWFRGSAREREAVRYTT